MKSSTQQIPRLNKNGLRGSSLLCDPPIPTWQSSTELMPITLFGIKRRKPANLRGYMKVTQTKDHPIQWLLSLAIVALLFCCLLHPSDGRMAALLVVGSIYLTLWFTGRPDQWRTRGGSLIPASFLVGFTWFSAGIATACALFRPH